MTIYTDDISALVPQSVTGADAGKLESLGVSFSSAFREGIVPSLARMYDAREAIEDENSPMMSKGEADNILKEYNITNIKIPDDGVTTRYIDYLKQEAIARAKREQLLQRAPDHTGSGTASFLASLAGGVADPANAGLMLIPVVGEVKAASLLGRTGQRFLQGAKVGGIQTTVFQPAVSQAAIMEGENYSNFQSMTNIVFGTLAGGTIVSLGGATAEGIGRLRAYRKANKSIGPNEAIDSPLHAKIDSNTSSIEPVNNFDYHLKTADDMAFSEVINPELKGLESSSELLLNDKQLQAINNQLAEYRLNLSESRLQKNSFKIEKDYINQGQSRKNAKLEAEKDITQLKNDLTNKVKELEDQLDYHQQALQAIDDINTVKNGGIPQRFKSQFEARKNEILETIKGNKIPSETAIEKINNTAPVIRNNALRASIGQAFKGKIADVEPFFDLADPLKSQNAIRKLADNGVKLDENINNLLNQIDNDLKNTGKTTDYQQAVDNLNHQYEITAAKAQQNNQDSVRTALDDVMNYANDETVSKAARAYALCRIGR